MKKFNLSLGTRQSLLFLSFLMIFVSCYTPSPIYGTWADNTGSKITFIDDGSYTATIVNSAGEKTLYQGSWTVMENVLIFTKESGSSINTEWDIRGSMLYLDWVDDEGEIQSLVLYHVSK